MTDYLGNRRNERVTYRRVSWPGWVEGEELTQFASFSISRSIFASVKESGSASFSGKEAPDDHDLLRIYYGFEDDEGETSERVIATMRMSMSEPTYDMGLVSGDVELAGMLQVLSDRHYGMPFVVEAGTSAVSLARELCEGAGLRVNAAESSYKTSACHTFDASDADYLTIVNWLLDAAGFASAYTDAYGTVQMQPYVEPTERAVSWTFDDGEYSVMQPEVAKATDWADTPNAVRLYYESDECTLWASAVNVDADSRASTVSRDAEVTCFEEVSELDGGTASEKLASLEARAKSTLLDNSSEIEYVTVSHPWLPLEANQSVGVSYTAAGLEWRGSVTNQDITSDAGCPTTSKMRKYVSPALEVEIDGGILYEAEEE